jgi:perosamine synthetase
MKEEFTEFVKQIYQSDRVLLHRPIFAGNEKQYLVDCIDSNFVSSVGKKVDEFERLISEFTASRFAIATVNGTAALHTCLHLAGVCNNDEVITQALTFVATCNAISYCEASPVFIDVDKDTMGMSPVALENFLNEFCEIRDGYTFNKTSGKRIKACVPMHTFGIPCRILEISAICKKWNISVVEDAAESLGSFYNDQHTGTFGDFGTLSFNGNKIITTGGGGMILTGNESLALRSKYITTTAKVPHPYEFFHDEIGFNYRLPNLNAALGCAQMEQLNSMLNSKQGIYNQYKNFFNEHGFQIAEALPSCVSNNWLNALILNDKSERDSFLNYTNENGVMTRPIWKLMTELPMYKGFQRDELTNSYWLQDRVVNIPSSVPN